VNDEKMAPVSFRAAKPVDPKTRHPFSGEVLGADEGVEQAVRQPDGFWRTAHPPATPPEAFRTVMADLRLRREELDRVINLLERFMP
jgi:hypothetical protein